MQSQEPKNIMQTKTVTTAEIAEAQLLIAELIISNPPFNELIKKIISLICTLFHWDLGEYVVKNNDSFKNEYFYNHTETEAKEFEKFSKELILPVDIGLNGKIYKEKNAVFISDFAYYKTFPRSRVAGESGIHSAYGFPIQNDNEVSGIINFFSFEIKQENQSFKDFLKGIGFILGKCRDFEITISNLSAQEIGFKTSVEHISEGIWIIDNDNKTTFTNDTLCKMLDCTKQELKNVTPFVFMENETHATIINKIWSQKESKQTAEMEIKLFRKEGFFKCHLKIIPLFLDMTHLGTALLLSDISKKNSSQNHLNKATNLYINMLYNVPAGIIIHRNDKIIFCNDTILNVLQYSPHEIINQSIYKLIHPNSWNSVREKISSVNDIQKTSQKYKEKFIDARGNPIDAEIISVPIMHKDELAVLSFITDTTMQKSMENEILHLKNIDPTTGTLNFSSFVKKIENEISAGVTQNLGFALMVINIDNFRRIIDAFGYNLANELLKLAAMRLQNYSEKGYIGRLEGDLFAVIIESKDRNALSYEAEKIIDLFRSPFSTHGNTFFLSITIGISVYPFDGINSNQLLKGADLALSQAKKICKGSFKFITTQDLEEMQHGTALAEKVYQCFNEGKTEIFFQPIVGFRTNEILGFEALLRLKDADGVFIAAEKFIPIISETGLLESYWTEIFEKCCTSIKRIRENHKKDFFISINLSSRQLANFDFPNSVLKTVNKFSIDPTYIQLEITENSLIYYPKQALKLLKEIKEYGIRISIDDFGTGYSSFKYLQNFVVSNIKIDKSFINKITTNKSDLIVTKGIIALGHALGAQITAEGIETKEQFDLLNSLGCDEAQGYYICKPLPEETLDQFLNKYFSSSSNQ